MLLLPEIIGEIFARLNRKEDKDNRRSVRDVNKDLKTKENFPL